jgi:hypothetical protein
MVDLSDDRRANKPWLPADDRDVTGGLVSADSWGLPSCTWHGAMNRISSEGRLYRCSESQCGVGAQMIELPGED